MRVLTLVASLGTLLLSVGTLEAALLISNLDRFDTSTTFLSTTDLTTIYAGRFTTGPGSAWRLTSATTIMERPISVDVTLEASIWSSAGSTPDTQLNTFANTPIIGSGSGGIEVSFTSPGITLDPDSQYWLAIRATGGDILAWGSTTWPLPVNDNFGWTQDIDLTAQQVGGGSWEEPDWGGSAFTTHTFLFRLDGEPVQAVPEPTSLALSGLGALGMGLIASRRRKKEKKPAC